MTTDAPSPTIGQPLIHLPETPSTNMAARELADKGATHGTVVTTDHQTAGRGRQGRTWESPPGAITLSVIVREGIDRLLPLRAGLAAAQVGGASAHVKWPNDVLVNGRKIAGVLVERAGEAAIVGIGLNAAVKLEDLPDEVAATAGTLGRAMDDLPIVQTALLARLQLTLAMPADAVVAALAARDSLVGQAVRWAGGEGVGAGIAEDGRLRVSFSDGTEVLLEGGEIHLY